MSSIFNESLPFDILFMIMTMLPARDRIRVARTNRKFHDAVSCSWSQEKEVPDVGPVPDATLVSLINHMHNLQVLDFDCLSSKALELLRPKTLARNCSRIISFKSVQLNHLSLVSSYVRALRLPVDRVLVQSIDLQLQDWQVTMPHLYQHMSDIFAMCGQLKVIRLENASYGLLRAHEVWRLIGSRITCLEISCPYISVMDVFRPGPALRRVSSSFTQSDFDYLCDNCTQLEVLAETTFFREPLPDHNAVIAIQSDPTSDSDLILDLRPLRNLKCVKCLTLTSLISPESRQHLSDFLKERGYQLQTLDLNLSNGPVDVLEDIFRYCHSLKRLVLFFECKSSGSDVTELTEKVKEYAGPSTVDHVLVFRHDRRTISMPAL